MTNLTALVIGGTGPTGPDIIEGLLGRGYRTTIFHSGRHEVPLPASVEHIHGDPHFPDTIAEALGERTFDVAVAQYGRLRHLVGHLRGRVGHIVAIGGMMGPLLPSGDPRWGALGRPAIVREDRRLLIDAPGEGDRLGFRIAEAARELFAAERDGAFRATYVVYPLLYGPRQPGSPEWAVVRRLRDRRRSLIVPDGGLRLESRAFVHNVSQAPLLAIDKPDVAAGKTYVVTDTDVYTVRQRVEFIARHLGVDVELVNLPYELAGPAHPMYRKGPEHRVGLGDGIRAELGYQDRYDTAQSLALTVDWLMGADPEAIAEIERQLADPFDYAAEDALLSWWASLRATAPTSSGPFEYSHMYRHPERPDEDWRTKGSAVDA